MQNYCLTRFLLTLVFFQTFHGKYVYAQQDLANNQTWSDRLLSIETDKNGNNELVLKENHFTNQIFNQSKNKTIINAMLADRLDVETVIQKQVLSDKSEISLVDHGLGKSTELIQKSASETKKLLSNFNIKRNNSVAFISFSISTDEKLAIVFSEQNGSIDDYQLNLIDLEKSLVISSNLVAKGHTVVWTAQNKFAFTDPMNRNKQIEIDAFNNFSKTEYMGVKFFGNYPSLMKCGIDNIQKVVLNGSQEIILNGLNCKNWSSRPRKKSNEITVVTNLANDHHEIIQYLLNKDSKIVDPNKLFEFDGLLQEAHFLDNHYFIQTSWGAEQKLIILDDKGTLLQTVLVPSYASITSIQTKTIGQSVNITLESMVVKDQVFELNYLTGQWVTPITEDKLLKKTNIEYVSEVVMVKVRDGVQIPLRLTRLTSTKLDSSTPVLMEVYGGFDKPGKIYPQFNSAVRNLFLNKGGVYAAPAIRGGNEFGESWYQAASNLNKMISLYDIIDVTDFLTQNKWTSRDKIIITGTSNGGFSVTAAALLSPKSFGLVVPISGVYDIIGINRLDPRFAKGWWNDDGNPDVAIYAEAIKQFSPLEIELPIIESLPNFLFINGLNDSRVNPLHSIKMVKKLRLTYSDTDKVHALFLKNAGHWIASQAYQDYIALRENSIVWNFVYKQLGW